MGQNGSRELKKPVVAPIEDKGSNGTVSYGYVGVQGWRKQMEDAHVARVNIGEYGPNSGFFGIFDGHGGPGAANFAADHMLDYLLAALQPLNEAHPSFGEHVVPEVQRAFLSLDAHMREHVADYRTAQDMEDPGTTACCVLLLPHHVVFCHVGDCRAFLVRNGQILHVTEDHKPDNTQEKTRIEAAGGFVARGRVCNCLAVSRALGDHLFKEARERGPEQQMVSAEPTVTVLTRTSEDELLVLACDGLFDVLRPLSVSLSLSSSLLHGENGDICASVREVVSEAMKRGSTDNVSTMCVVLGKEERKKDVDTLIDGLFDFGGEEEEEEEEEGEEEEGEAEREAERAARMHSAERAKITLRLEESVGDKEEEEREREKERVKKLSSTSSEKKVAGLGQAQRSSYAGHHAESDEETEA